MKTTLNFKLTEIAKALDFYFDTADAFLNADTNDKEVRKIEASDAFEHEHSIKDSELYDLKEKHAKIVLAALEDEYESAYALALGEERRFRVQKVLWEISAADDAKVVNTKIAGDTIEVEIENPIKLINELFDSRTESEPARLSQDASETEVKRAFLEELRFILNGCTHVSMPETFCPDIDEGKVLERVKEQLNARRKIVTVKLDANELAQKMWGYHRENYFNNIDIYADPDIEILNFDMVEICERAGVTLESSDNDETEVDLANAIEDVYREAFADELRSHREFALEKNLPLIEGVKKAEVDSGAKFVTIEIETALENEDDIKTYINENVSSHLERRRDFVLSGFERGYKASPNESDLRAAIESIKKH